MAYATTTDDISTADFFIETNGDRRGHPTKEHHAGCIGVKVTDLERLLPSYLFYLMDHFARCGYLVAEEVITKDHVDGLLGRLKAEGDE